MDDPASDTKEPEPIDWVHAAQAEFARESDRAAGIVLTAIIDMTLRDLLEKRLVAPLSKEHNLLAEFNGPLGNFSSRINAAHQLGLISGVMARDLHLMRKIRNDFSHLPFQCTFDESPIKSRVTEMSKQSRLLRDDPKLRARAGPTDTRHDFLSVALWILFSLRNKCERQVQIPEAGLEFGYRDFEEEGKRIAEQEARETEG